MPHVCFWFAQGLFNNIDRAGKGFLVFKVRCFCCCKRASWNIPGCIFIHVEKDKVTLFSNHSGSLLRQQPEALDPCTTVVSAICMAHKLYTSPVHQRMTAHSSLVDVYSRFRGNVLCHSVPNLGMCRHLALMMSVGMNCANMPHCCLKVKFRVFSGGAGFCENDVPKCHREQCAPAHEHGQGPESHL